MKEVERVIRRINKELARVFPELCYTKEFGLLGENGSFSEGDYVEYIFRWFALKGVLLTYEQNSTFGCECLIIDEAEDEILCTVIGRNPFEVVTHAMDEVLKKYKRRKEDVRRTPEPQPDSRSV